jgi:hypothetical protein
MDASTLPSDWRFAKLEDGRILLSRTPVPVARSLMAALVAAVALALGRAGWFRLPTGEGLALLGGGAVLLVAALWVALAQETFCFASRTVEREWRFLGLRFTRKLVDVFSVTSGQRLRRSRWTWSLHLKGRDGSRFFLESTLAEPRKIDALAHWLEATCGIPNIHQSPKT